jgi:ABC-type multidrug transport system fused ATPase/permease subunit
MAWLDPLIALLAVLLIPAYFLAMKILGRRIRPLSSAWIKSWSGMIALVQENLGLIPVIKAFSREPVESQRFEEKNAHFLDISRKQILVQSVLSPAIALLSGAGLLLLLWVGVEHVRSDQLSTDQLVSLLLYAMMLTRPVAGLANVYGQVMRTRGAAERLLEFFAVNPEPVGQGEPLPGRARGEICFEGVSFGYPAKPLPSPGPTARVSRRWCTC